MSDPADEPVPRLPRGRGLRLAGPEMFRILVALVTLVGVIVLARPCAQAVSNFVMSYEQGSGSALPRPGNVDEPKPAPHYEQLSPNMSEQQLREAVERARARAAGSGSDAR